MEQPKKSKQTSKTIIEMQNSYNKTPDNRHKDPKNYIWSVFYFNKEDDRVFVPKPIEWMGMTLNFANIKSYWTLLAMIAFFGFIIFMIEKKT